MKRLDIGSSTGWRVALAGCDAVVLRAARVNMIRDKAHDPLGLYRETNSEATFNLARQAADAAEKRFVFISTIKVNGEGRDAAYRENDVTTPSDSYAISKGEAEQGLQRVTRETGLEFVILRPLLVYGPGVKANSLRLMRTVERGWPLPQRAIRNRRSLLYLGNFFYAIRLRVEPPDVAGQTFLPDGGLRVSTPDMSRALANAMGRLARLLEVPAGVFGKAGALPGKREAIARLVGSLYVEGSFIRSRRGWTRPYPMEAGLAATVAALA